MTNLFFIFLLFISGMVACQAENEPIAAPIEQQVTISTTRVAQTPTLTRPTIAPQNTPTQVTATPTLIPEGTPGFGSLTVDSNLPDALVYVNQNQVGQTPYQGYWPAGTYTITVSLPGFQPWQQQISLSDLQSQQLTADFSFTPKIEQLLDTLIDVFWWAEDGNAIYYVKCSDTGCQYGDRHEQNDIPIWKLDLSTRESTQVNDSWPPTWIPREYAPLIPDTISGRWVYMSPSGQKALYFEHVAPPPLTPDPFNDQSQGFIYNVHIILGNNIVINLGEMDGAPSQRTSWSADEQLILIPTEPMSPGRYGGWLVNLNDNTLSPVEPPIPTETRINLTTSIIWPDGKAILCDIGQDQDYLWYFLESEPTLIPVNFRRPLGWVSDNYMFTEIYGDEVNYVWYDVVTGISKAIIANSDLPGYLWEIKVQKDQALLQFFSVEEGKVPGLWLLTFDTE